VFSIIIGLKMASKYFEFRKKEFIPIGLTYIFLSSAWWGTLLSFLTVLVFGQPINKYLFVILNNAFLPFALVFWISVYSQMNVKRKKLVQIIFGIICILWELVLFLFLIVDINILYGFTDVPESDLYYSNRKIVLIIFPIIGILSALITGLLFARVAIKSEDPKTVWKGRFLAAAFISFCIGAFLDALLPRDLILLVIIRLILIASVFEYYLGFFLPDKIANVLIK
jgi:hypothetical protein